MFWQRRARVVRYWVSGQKYSVSLPEIVRFFFGKTCAFKAKPKIQSMEEIGEYLVVRFFDLENPLYYPKRFRGHSLFQVITEGFCKEDWHFYEIEETKVNPNDIVIDCGAAEGLFSLQVAGRCKQVFAIEPLPAFAEAMQLTFAPFSNVKIVQVALANSETTARFSQSDISSRMSDRQDGVQVKVTTVDSLFLSDEIPITYIKADLEGSDFDMIKGATEIIRKNNPKIAVTTYHNPRHAEEIAAHLRLINPAYNIKVKGLAENGAPVMLHAWVDN